MGSGFSKSASGFGLFFPNEDEFIQMTFSSDLEEALDKFSDFETCIVVKRGVKGAVLQEKGERISIPAYHIPDYTDAIGAGDSFNTGFIHSFLMGKNRKECLEMGTLTAAISTTAAGGTAAVTSYQKVIEKGKNLRFLAS